MVCLGFERVATGDEGMKAHMIPLSYGSPHSLVYMYCISFLFDELILLVLAVFIQLFSFCSVLMVVACPGSNKHELI